MYLAWLIVQNRVIRYAGFSRECKIQPESFHINFKGIANSWLYTSNPSAVLTNAEGPNISSMYPTIYQEQCFCCLVVGLFSSLMEVFLSSSAIVKFETCVHVFVMRLMNFNLIPSFHLRLSGLTLNFWVYVLFFSYFRLLQGDRWPGWYKQMLSLTAMYFKRRKTGLSVRVRSSVNNGVLVCCFAWFVKKYGRYTLTIYLTYRKGFSNASGYIEYHCWAHIKQPNRQLMIIECHEWNELICFISTM